MTTDLAALDRLVPGGVTRGELDRGDHHRGLRWIAAGTGGPPIVLVAGAGECGLDWAPLLPALARLSTVVCLDRAGLGASDPVPRVSVEQELADLVALLAHVGPAVVVGHSWGGLLAQLAAARTPVAGLVLVDPAHEQVNTEMPVRLRLVAAAMGVAVVPLYLTGLMPRLTRPMGLALARRATDDPALQTSIVDAYVDAYRRRHQVAMIARENRLVRASLVRPLRGTLPDVPLVALAATTGKPPRLQRLSTSLIERVAASVPRGRLVVVEGAGHYIHHDQPQAVIASIADVLAAASPAEHAG